MKIIIADKSESQNVQDKDNLLLYSGLLVQLPIKYKWHRNRCSLSGCPNSELNKSLCGIYSPKSVWGKNVWLQNLLLNLGQNDAAQAKSFPKRRREPIAAQRQNLGATCKGSLKIRFETFGENFQNGVSLRCNLLSCRADVESFLCLRQEIFWNDLDSVWQTDIESTKELFGENHRSWSTLLPQNHLLSFVKKFELRLIILIANSWTNTDFPSLLSETCF